MPTVRVQVEGGEDQLVRLVRGQSGDEVVIRGGEGLEFAVSENQELRVTVAAPHNLNDQDMARMRALGAQVPVDRNARSEVHPSTERLVNEEAKRPSMIGSSMTPDPNTNVDPRAVTSPKAPAPSRVAVNPTARASNTLGSSFANSRNAAAAPSRAAQPANTPGAASTGASAAAGASKSPAAAPAIQRELSKPAEQAAKGPA